MIVRFLAWEAAMYDRITAWTCVWFGHRWLNDECPRWIAHPGKRPYRYLICVRCGHFEKQFQDEQP